MPNYSFQHPKTGKIVDVYQSMNDEHIYIENGVKFDRVFTSPNASFDSKIDPFSQNQFIEKSGKMKGTLGEIWDYSAEMSQKRKNITGKDEIREKAEANYSKKRKGMKYKEKTSTNDMTFTV